MVIVIGLAIIASFAIAAILVDPTDGYQEPRDPRAELPLWALLGRR
jgi:hypothetical protein